MFTIAAGYFGGHQDPASLVILFFSYSLLGYLMECLVLTAEHRSLVMNRGFVRHLPFCIIYGFGAIMGYAFLKPFESSYLLLFLLGAAGATVFEYLTAQIQLRIFGSFWWDYTGKPFNYRGLLCLESTFGWGILAIFIVKVAHNVLVDLIRLFPANVATPLAMILIMAYVLDFAWSARRAYSEKGIHFVENAENWLPDDR